MVLRRGKQPAAGRTALARIEPGTVEVESVESVADDPLSGAPVGGGMPVPGAETFAPPDPDTSVPGGPAAAPRRRVEVTARDEALPDARRGGASRMLRARIALVAVMAAAIAVLAGRAFDQFVPELLLPPVTVAGAALVARRWRLGYRVLLAAVAAAAATAAVGLIRGVRWGALLGEIADGPRRLITTEWPSPLDGGVLMIIALGLAMMTASAADLAGRARFHVAPLAPIAAGFAGAMVIAAPVHPARWPMAVAAVAAVMLLLARPSDAPRRRLRLMVAERSLAATAAGLVIIGALAASAIAWTDRADPRRDVDADTTLSLLDPVEQMVALRNASPGFDLFTVADRSALIGPSLPTRWRLSALDQYDGQRWLPAVTLRPIGSRLGLPTASNPDVAPPIEYELTFLSDDTSLVPLPGRPLEFDADGDAVIETDEQRTVVRLVDTPAEGTTARVTAEVAPTDAGPNDSTARRQLDEVARTFEERADQLAGDGTIIEQLRAIESTMRDEWSLDDDAPGGQQLRLIDEFVNTSNRGTREQFATTFALLARSLGVEARVATGLLVPPDELDSPLTLRSRHAAVWPEVRLIGTGWLAFDPIPAQQAGPDDDTTPPPSEQSPAAAQPPPPEPPERSEEPAEDTTEPEVEATGSGSVSVWVIRAAIAGGAVILPVFAAIATILFVKWRRRRRRLRAADPAQRIVGAWANATDSLVDAGLTIGSAWTDDRIAERANAIAPAIPHDLRRLAAAATSMTFGRTERSRFYVDDAVATSHTVDVAIRSDRSRWQRIRWRLSTRSLRTTTRSPVTE